MRANWEEPSEDAQYVLAHASLEEVVETLAEQADIFAEAIESGVITDQGGAESLRTFAKLARFQARNAEYGATIWMRRIVSQRG